MVANEYASNSKNIELVSVGYVWQQRHSDIFKYIDSPVGTKLIRISSDDFEIYNNDKEIFVKKR